MSASATGLGSIELAVLDALDALGATARAPTVKNATVLRRVELATGLPARAVYETVCLLADVRVVHIPLFVGQGNLGNFPDDPAANPRYTEVRMTPVGEALLGLHRSGGPDLPIGLINGSVHVDGSRPPFDPIRIFDALDRLADDPGVSDDELLALAGQPSFPSGCSVDGDLGALVAGEDVAVACRANLEVIDEAGRATLEVTRLPPGSSPVRALDSLRARARSERRRERHRELDEQMIAISDLDVRSSRGSVRLLIGLDRGADPDAEAAKVREVWGVTTTVTACLTEPLAATLRRHGGSDPGALRAATRRIRSLLPTS